MGAALPPPLPLRIFSNPPIKTDASHGAHPPLKNEAPLPHLKNNPLPPPPTER